MAKSAFHQALIILVISLVLGVLNNLRPSAKIEWVRAWPSFSAVMGEPEAPAEKAPDTAQDAQNAQDSADSEAASEAPMDPDAVFQMIVENRGITTIGLKEAKSIHEVAQDITFWIDARDEELYNQGHITGSHLLYLYEKNSYLPEIQAAIAEAMPEALVVYCKGKTCTDSHHLAEDLATLGYANIFVYKDGFDDWFKAGLPIEGTMTQAAPSGAVASSSTDAAAEDSAATNVALTLPEAPSGGMYLEHILRDLIPFVFGIFLLVTWRKTSENPRLLWVAAAFAGAFFIWAALPKINNPFEFAKSIWNYDIAPAAMINFSALLMPMLELLAGLALIFGVMRKGGAFIVSALLVIFIVAVSYNVMRGHEFNCGCTSTATLFTDAFIKGFNDKFMLILRDIGLLVMSLLAFKLKK